MKPSIKNDILVAKKFNNAMRYIDDLLKLNNRRFEKEIENIYPHALKLKKTMESPTTLSYLRYNR